MKKSCLFTKLIVVANLMVVANSPLAQTLIDITPRPLVAVVANPIPSQRIVSPFATGVSVKLNDAFGNPLVGSVVRFDVPPNPWGATFLGQSVAFATTDANGIATSPVPIPQVLEPNPVVDRSGNAIGFFSIASSTSSVSNPIFSVASLTFQAASGSQCGAFFFPSGTPTLLLTLNQVSGNRVRVSVTANVGNSIVPNMGSDVVAGVDIFDGNQWIARIPTLSSTADIQLSASSRVRNIQARFGGTCLFGPAASNVLPLGPTLPNSEPVPTGSTNTYAVLALLTAAIAMRSLSFVR